jgi:hypothetical protein
MLTLTDFRFATVSELFRYKQEGFELPSFPGYSSDQWGIKAHNRPWIEETGAFKKDLKIIEVGGAYSTLPVYLAKKFNLEAWIGDDFGESTGEKEIWARWGDPHQRSDCGSKIKYIFKPFGDFSIQYPDSYFDRVFSVSTLEHIPFEKIIPVFRDMHRVLAKGGVEMHTIDIYPSDYKSILLASMFEYLSVKLNIEMLRSKFKNLSPTWRWLQVIKESGVDISRFTNRNYPYSEQLLTKNVLFESYDVVYRFYPPNNSVKIYHPSASLLVVIQDV